MNPRQAWQAVLGQLQMEMPKSSFDAWVRDTQPLHCDDGSFVIGAADQRARDWLESRLASTAARLLTGMMNQPVQVRFVVQETESNGGGPAPSPAQAWEQAKAALARSASRADAQTWIAPAEFISYEGEPFSGANASVLLHIGVPNAAARDWLSAHLQGKAERLLSDLLARPVRLAFALPEEAPASHEEGQPGGEQLLLEAVREDLLEAFTRPGQVHVMPQYLLRWLPYAHPGHFLTLIAFRQAMYCATNQPPVENAPFGASIRSIARIVGANKDTILAHRDTWLLRWFLKHIPNRRYTFHPQTGQVRRQTDRYLFLATTPLTPGDQDALQTWLLDHGIQRDPLAALEKALARHPKEILPHPAPKPNALLKQREPSDHNRNFNHLVLSLCPPDLPPETLSQVLDLAGRLRQHVTEADKLAFVNLYFLRHWVPLLGNGAACTVIVCRQRVYANQATGEVRESFRLPGGFQTLSNLTGLSASTLRKLFPLPTRSGRGGKRPGRKRGVGPGGQAPDAQRARRRAERRELVGQIIHQVKKPSPQELLIWARKSDPLVPEHQEEYEAATRLLAAFLAAHRQGFGEAHIEAFLERLIQVGAFPRKAADPFNRDAIGEDLDNAVGEYPDDEVGEGLDDANGGSSDNKIGDNGDMGIGFAPDMEFGEDSDIPVGASPDKRVGENQDMEGWLPARQLNNLRFKYLRPKTLKDILLPLATTPSNDILPRRHVEHWTAGEGDGWKEVFPPTEIKALFGQAGDRGKLELELMAAVSHWLHVYSPNGEGIRLPRQYVRSQLRDGPYGPVHMRLAAMGPKALSDLVRSTTIAPGSGELLVEGDLPGKREWLRIMRGVKDHDHLLELAERVGLLVYGEASDNDPPARRSP